MENYIEFWAELVELKSEMSNNSDVQSGCWGDTGSGAYC